LPLTSDFAGAVELEGELGGDIDCADVRARLYEVRPADDDAGFSGNQDEVGARVGMLKTDAGRFISRVTRYSCDK
jgi:hypothetical protein